MRLPAALPPLLRLLISPLLILSSLSLNRAHTASLSSASTSTSASTLSSTSFLSLSLSLSRAGCNDPSHTYDQLVAFGSHLASRRRFRQSAHCYKRALDSYWQSLRSPTGEHAAFMQFTQSKAHEMRILDTHISHLSRRTERMNIPMFGHRDPDQRYDDEGRPQIPPQVILERHLAAMCTSRASEADRSGARGLPVGSDVAIRVPPLPPSGPASSSSSRFRVELPRSYHLLFRRLLWTRHHSLPRVFTLPRRAPRHTWMACVPAHARESGRRSPPQAGAS